MNKSLLFCVVMAAVMLHGCGGGAETVENNVTPPAPTVSLSANPGSVSSGNASTLTWTSTNATTCNASGGWSGGKAVSGSESTVALSQTSTFTLSCDGASGSANDSVTVTVTAGTPPPTVTLTANPVTVSSGNASTLTWTSTDATTCTASGDWSGGKATSGSESTVALSQTSTFTLSCDGAGGSGSDSVTVTVSAGTPAPTVSLSANPGSVTSGNASTLSWTSTDATSCTASGDWSGGKATTGSESTAALSQTSTFTLSCDGAGGTGSDSVTVSVTTNGAPQATFTKILIEASQAPWGKTLADLNGDGFLDIVVGGGGLGTNVFWYRYPDWQKFQIGDNSGGDDIKAGDINGDGALDVVVNANPLSWYENPAGSGGNPEGQWSVNPIVSQRSHDVVLADIDRNGRLDIAVRIADAGAIPSTRIYLQTGADSWTDVGLSNDSSGTGGLALADIDDDGRIDVVGDGYWLRQPSTNVTSGSSWARYTIGSWPAGSSIDTGDLNNDGNIDVTLAVSEVGAGDISWFEAPDDPLTQAWIRHDFGTVEDAHRHHLVDINNDGDLDVVFAEMNQSANDRVGIYNNDGDAQSWTLQILATHASHNLAVGDVGNDGDIDILGANWQLSAPANGDIFLWQNDLDTSSNVSLDDWTYVQIDNSKSDKAFGLNFADVDGDGRIDIVAGRYWYGNPGGNLSGSWARTDFGTGIDAMLITDVDGDNRVDVIAQGEPSGDEVPVIWIEATDAAGSIWDQTGIGSVPRDPADGRSQGYRVAQIESGGRSELVFSSVGIHYFTIPSNPSAGNWPRVNVTLDAREEGIATADIDSDGNLDIVGIVAPSGMTIAWWENPGDGSGSWLQHDLGDTDGIVADRVETADIDNDGKLDVIVTETNNAATASNKLLWFKQPSNAASNSWNRTTVIANQPTLNSMDVADINKDGRIDIVSGEHRGSEEVEIWENIDGGSNWVRHLVDSGKEGHLGTQLVDLDGDGDLDIVSIAFDDSQNLHLWRNDTQ